MTKGWSRI